MDNKEPSPLCFGKVEWYKKDVKCCACKQEKVHNTQPGDLCRSCTKKVEEHGED
jgi:hypothetical protein